MKRRVIAAIAVAAVAMGCGTMDYGP